MCKGRTWVGCKVTTSQNEVATVSTSQQKAATVPHTNQTALSARRNVRRSAVAAVALGAVVGGRALFLVGPIVPAWE